MDRLIPTADVALASVFAKPGVFPFLLSMLGWGCSHDNYTVPMRLPGGTELTVSCLQCAARLRYDWERMALADSRSKPASESRQRALEQPKPISVPSITQGTTLVQPA